MRLPSLLVLASLLVITQVQAATFNPDLYDLNALPLHTLPMAAVQSAVTAAESNTRPLQFAVGMSLPLAVQDGAWQQIDGTTWRWRTRVKSAGAQTLSLTFSKFRMPEGASLWIYDTAGQVVQGPYTHANETPGGKLWTPAIMGDTVIIEARVPAAQRDAMQLQLGEVNHGFRGFGGNDTIQAKAAGSCEIDVICPAGDAWRNEIRSVARISIGGQFLCTGQLVNNTQQNNDPLFLTANHCGIEQTPGGPAASVVFYWNYQNSTCRSNSSRNGNGSLAQTQTGGSLVAQDVGSDFTLVRLNTAPSASFNVYYSGWNAQGAAPQSGSVIHHPNGDEKSISFYNTAATPRTVQLCDGTTSVGSVCLSGARTIQAWQIGYSSGVTEPGSSGGGLWDQNHLLVGQLSGGNTSCSNQTGTDDYGRFDIAFTANSNQLKTSLDPSNTGATSLPGKDAAGAATPIPADSPPGSPPATPAAASSGGGGGAMAPLFLIGLLGMAALRRRK